MSTENVTETNEEVMTTENVTETNEEAKGMETLGNSGEVLPFRPMEPEKQGRGAELFDLLFRPTLLYALLFTICLYDNAKGILVAVLAIGTMVYCRFIEKRSGCERKKGKIWYEILFVLLGLSCGLTDNTGIVVFNLLGMFAVLMLMLLHDYKDDSEWSLPRYMAEIIRVFEKTLDGLFSFFKDVKEDTGKEKEEGQKKTSAYILTGLVVAIPLLVLVSILLASADVVFADVLQKLFQLESLPTLCLAGLMLIAAFFLTYAGMRYFVLREETRTWVEKERYEPLIAITALAAVTLVYLVFSGIQIAYLFVGNLKLPKNYTYAQYAREGFFQLLVVCILNLGIVVVVLSQFRENKVLKALLVVICGCTYIMISSSALRMIMYIREYALTRKRVLVLWALATLAIILVGVIIQIFRAGFPLFKYMLAVSAICYLVLSFGRMDYWIADYDTDHIVADIGVVGLERMPNESSLEYLNELSADAVPVLKFYSPEPWLNQYGEKMKDLKEDSWRQWNLSRAMARWSIFCKQD